MFLIVDNTHRKIREEIKRKLNGVGVPCVIADVNHCDLYMPCALVIVTERYLLEDVKYISMLNGKSPVFLWDESDIIEFSAALYKELYDIDIFSSKQGRLVCKGNEILFCGKKLRLTKTEKRIIFFLNYSNGWHDREKLAAYCLKEGKKDKDAIPVHICNINAKAKRLTTNRLIKYKRYIGYSI